MKHFSTITSFADLKKQYRQLAIKNHPDKGGDVAAMQEINNEFETLFAIWEHKSPVIPSYHNGYENDYDGVTARQYTGYVHDEYKWMGSRYKGQGNKDITQAIRTWLKETYPRCKFSVTLHNYSSISVKLMQADFIPFKDEFASMLYHSINHYHIDSDEKINDRCKEIMNNITGYMLSYNYDDSDIMTDYHCTNFFIDIKIGSYEKPFQCVIPQLKSDVDKKEYTFKHPEGPAHKAIRLAMKDAVWHDIKFRNGTTENLLCSIGYYNNEINYNYLCYGGYKTALKRANSLKSAGIKCSIVNRSRIRFDGYEPETEEALIREDKELEAAKKEWELNKNKPKSEVKEKPVKPTESKTKVGDSQLNTEGIQIVSYSEKSFAVIGDTKPIKDLLKELRGMWNRNLTCGAGWIFPVTKLEEVKSRIGLTE